MQITILSGVPGSGKSHWAKAQANTTIVSADNYLPENPRPQDFGIAHAKCMSAFMDFVRYGGMHKTDKQIIVDNTNTTAVEIAPYYLTAQADELTEIRVLRLIPDDFEAAYKRNTHKVPFKTFCVMTANFLKRDVMPWWEVQDINVS